ncbi:MAG TPA: AraC family transcriptional regulator ligand-binding domain-containing protein [Pseudomonadales bacterium]|nr:AraC family transcriptional regulator ligand-binding domain-containing protein [Pseudomonadales bacterium]
MTRTRSTSPGRRPAPAARRLNRTLPGGSRGYAGMARVGVLAGYRRVVQRLGGDPGALLRGFGLDPEALDDTEAWYPYADMIDLLEYTAAELGRVDFGIELAAHQGLLATLGPVALLAQYSDTVADTMRALGSWLVVVQTRATAMEVDRDAQGNGRIRWRIRLPGRERCAQVNELNQAILQRILESLRGERFRALGVTFTHAPPLDLAPLEACFGPRLAFRGEVNELRVAAADMDARNPQADPLLRELTAGYVRRLAPEGSGSPLQGRVSALIRQLLPTGHCSLEVLADALRTHPRTLQRRLQDEGTDFRTLLEGQRRSFAMEYVSDPEQPLVHIAQRLGYADQPTFTRAFQRWFGQPPGAVRRASLRGDGHDRAPTDGTG